ncbi:MAG: TetR/AcrR family transcriptional regulator [Hahellaceae bacterium]|nr:TetR/AcrR family transcriptional regulator [Hahellaceae bacterium]
MGRPASFDRQDKLHQAMKVFWRYGYEAASVQVLCDALKLNRFSLYNAFGDKERLLNLALDHYGNTVIRRIQEPLYEPGGGLDAIRRYLNNLEEALQGKGGEWGCLMQVIASESRPPEAAVQRVTHGYAQLGLRLDAALQAARKRQSLRDDIDIPGAIQFLLVNVQGVLASRRRGVLSSDLALYFQFLRTLIASWQQP